MHSSDVTSLINVSTAFEEITLLYGVGTIAKCTPCDTARERTQHTPSDEFPVRVIAGSSRQGGGRVL